MHFFFYIDLKGIQLIGNCESIHCYYTSAFYFFFFNVFLKRGCNYQSECGQDSDSSITELQLQTLTLTPNTRISRPFNSTM